MNYILLTRVRGFALLLGFVLFITACVDKEPIVNNRVAIKGFNYPILKGKVDNPTFRVSINSEFDTEQVNSISIKVGQQSLSQIKSIQAYFTGKDSIYSSDIRFGKSEAPSEIVVIESGQTLQKGQNYFWVSCELSDDVDLNASIAIGLHSIAVDGVNYSAGATSGTPTFRPGVAVRQHNDDNVHTYRIPGLATTKDGSLLAIYDVRRESGRDLQGHMDIGVSRSTDKGNTWEPMRIALDMKEWGGLPEKFNGVSDACILVDDHTGDLYVAGLWMHGVITSEGKWITDYTAQNNAWNHQWRNKGSQPGWGVKETSQFLITKSTDDGKTWSKPRNITKMCKKKEWWLFAPAPGHGITLRDGTLVFPTQGRDKEGVPFSNITYSSDGGVTWTTSNPAKRNTTENMAVQLADGSILLNMRDNRNRSEKGDKNGRSVSVTKDLGETWTQHPTSNGVLIEPVCMASIHKHSYTSKDGSEKSVLFFSNPNSKYQRHKQTIKVSFDNGMTWPEDYWMELDEGRGAGYSCLTSIDEKTIGILYEGSQAHMTFQSVDVSGLLQ